MSVPNEPDRAARIDRVRRSIAAQREAAHIAELQAAVIRKAGLYRDLCAADSDGEDVVEDWTVRDELFEAIDALREATK